MHRTPKLKDQARLLREAYQEQGQTLSTGESLEIVARMNGYASWNAASAAQQSREFKANDVIEIRLKSWTIVHRHRHGEDIFTVYSDEAPDDDEAIAIINSQGGGFEEFNDESFEVLGVEVQNLKLTLGELEAKVVPTSPFEDQVLRVFEVDMTDHFDYDVPDTLAEWIWIAAKGSFAHRSNNVEPGVWEFMVYTDTALGDESCPADLKKFFQQAKKANCPWVMFHQG